MTTHVREATPADAATVLGLIHAAFGDRPVLDPPATATAETLESVGAALSRHGGLVAEHGGEPVGSLLLEPDGDRLRLRRVGVLKQARNHGVAHLLAAAAARIAQERGLAGLVLEARAELPGTVAFWEGQGYVEADRDGPRLRMVKAVPVCLELPTAGDTRALGVRLGEQLRAGDLVILTGDLGAGKTTLAQGVGEGLGVRGPITSPTFVISRVHPSLAGGPALIHVDAYRLAGSAELDDLDLDTDVDEAVTLVEWGSGLAESLSEDRLEVSLVRAADDVRTVTLTPRGRRWALVRLA